MFPLSEINSLLLIVTLVLIVTLNCINSLQDTQSHCIIVVKWRVHSNSRKEESNEYYQQEQRKKPQSK